MFEHLRSWSSWMEATDHRPDTIRNYRYWLVRFSADTLIDPYDVTEDDLVGYIAALPKTGVSRQMCLRSFKSFWSWAAPRAERDPTERLHLKRPKDGEAPHLPPHELRALIRAAFRRDHRRGWAIMLCAATGMRIGSLAALRAEDAGAYWAYLREAKGGNTYEVALKRAARIAVAHLAAEGRDTLIGVGHEGFRKWLRQAAKDAGIDKRVYPHLLRHSFGTALARVSDPDVWRRGMGHADLSQYPRYVHTDADFVLEKVEQAQVF